MCRSAELRERYAEREELLKQLKSVNKEVATAALACAALAQEVVVYYLGLANELEESET